ncbi:MAG: PAS domain-containing protein [Ignavibacteriales bacterium]|nr:PAS domain-containing protein [Ignavibacteriales bacterium]
MSYKSEKKRAVAEEELKESREKYRMLVETSGEGLIMILKNDQVYYNKTIYTILGYEYEEIDLRLEEIFPVPPASKIFDFKSQRFIKSSETTEQFECKIQNKEENLLTFFSIFRRLFLSAAPVLF